MKARLHLYPHAEPGATAYVIGEPAALRNLGETLIAASRSAIGLETTKLHTSDGHEYQIVAVADISENEWQTVPPPYCQLELPGFESVQNYQELIGTV